MSQAAVLGLMAPFFLLIIFAFLYPIARILLISVQEPTPGLGNYYNIFDNPLYATVLLRTLRLATIVSVLCLILAFPIALLMSRSRGLKLAVISIFILLPFWSSILVRTAAWAVLLQRNGLINQGLEALGLIDAPLRLLFTQTAVILAMTHVLIPFMVLPIYGALRNIPHELGRAASVCGASPLRVFWEVTLPLALPGVVGGFILVFLTSLGYFITPALLGSPQERTISTLISQQIREFSNWPFAAALVGVLLVVVMLLTLTFSRVIRFDRMMGARK
ncbi:MAG: ABC transporter permease [Aestuariivirga sp.]